MAQKINTDNMEVVLAAYNAEDVEGACMALNIAQIKYMRRKIGSGNNGNFLMSLNNYGEEIFVNKEDMDKAKQILDEWRRQKNEDRKNKKTETEAVSSTEDRKILLARIFSGIALAVIVVFYIIKYM